MLVFFFNDTATTEIYTLSLHDALPIFNFPPKAQGKPEFAFLQFRPMTARAELADVDITETEIEKAFC